MSYRYGDFDISVERREITRDGAPVAIEPKALDVLFYLIGHRDRVVARSELIDEVWEGRFISEAALSSAIKSARSAVGDNGKDQKAIKTYHGRGFRFVGTVERRGNASAAQAVPDADVDVTLPDRPSIAVLPIADIGGGPASIVAQGLTQDTTTGLARTRWLFVSALASARRLVEAKLDPAEIARRLGVRYLLHGTVQEIPGRFRLNATLSDMQSGSDIWADSLDRPLDDLFAVQTEVSGLVVAAVEAEIDLRERRQAILRPIESLDAWALYHRASDILYRFKLDQWPEAETMLTEAARLDPVFSRIPAALSFLHWQHAFLDLTPDHADALARATDFGAQSLELDPLDPFGHWAQGRAALLAGNLEFATEALGQCVELNPNFAMGAYSLGYSELMAQDDNLGLDMCLQARRISPYDPMTFAYQAHQGASRTLAGDPEDGARLMEKSLSHPNHHYQIYAIASWVNEAAGNHAKAERLAARLKELRPGYTRDDYFRVFPYRDPARDQIARHFAKLGL